MTTQEAFPIDSKKHRFNIIIEVSQNMHIFKIEKLSKDENITYQEVIGVLEIVKSGFLNQHREEIIKQQSIK